ncbi:L-cysteine:1D-myo-inositol 2-amino-2-deoxy-alpha-D-glucopyranoside ligase [Friedmanniella endophytica]|uniref:L-cysteine:1D-myo-inositol 2-amino-2-deoxy-alpha-D-glucopyranoside ligase n=1 Tax=Microlunatus kandeliicorticis TaxID=1759536 RepID=A0A7W3IU85_9ACTN|nr:cysteine--1-D-myo-inosityl 2-amino-2-deoxy-alpha-D-glucopyranoside ligase [Microlunatus kandeliicorticis]MBA8795309.1 L-cysteine:1D-myo-inositol 2-amino-2-deoxy-alpha-D-glucopyranoside ligase [Microlunatus kandeliicorticis]
MQAWRSPSIPQLTEPADGWPELLVRDTATGQLAPAVPADGGPARMYVCGITPYDATHMGHANTYLTFDLLNRAWRDRGIGVVYVQNITDVDDPLLERAEATGVTWTDLAEREIQLFRDDMTALNVVPPDHYIGAVESIDLVVGLIERLQRAGAVYPVRDEEYPDLYFRVHDDAAFGSVGHLSAEEAAATFAERGGDPDRPGKDDPLDCLVWRLERPGEPAWDSPFGRGRPGWHIECTAIALDRLGTDFDVQGGGSDLVFPHHEMCASGGRVATGEEFARRYVHGGMVGLDGEKMSKSKGNLVLVSRLREAGVDPMAVRLALLANRYADDWSWTDELQHEAEARLARWRTAVDAGSAGPADPVIAEVRAALAHDLDAPAALAAVDRWAGTDAGGSSGSGAEDGRRVAAAVDALLGVRLSDAR